MPPSSKCLGGVRQVSPNPNSTIATYNVSVTNSNADVEYLAFISYDSHPGCDATNMNPRRLDLLGKSDFTVGSSGSFKLSIDLRSIDCNGSAQVDIQAFNRQTRAPYSDKLAVAEVIQALPTGCNVPPLPPTVEPLTCKVNGNDTGNIGDIFKFLSDGGTAETKSWTTSGTAVTNPPTGNSFSSTFTTIGDNTVVVHQGDKQAVCKISIKLPPPPPPLSCSPSKATVLINEGVTFKVAGGDPTTRPTAKWNSDGIPPTGTGETYNVMFSTIGIHKATVVQGGPAVCQVDVVAPPPPPPTPTACLEFLENPVVQKGNGVATFTIKPGGWVEMSLVSYKLTPGIFLPQQFFDGYTHSAGPSSGNFYGPGNHTISVKVSGPSHHQVDLLCGGYRDEDLTEANFADYSSRTVAGDLEP